MSGATVVLTSQLASIAGCALTVFRLFRAGLHSRYRSFFWYFVYRAIDTVAALAIVRTAGVKSDLYFYFWYFTVPISWLFYIFVVFELYRLILEKHPGLYTLGRWGMYFGIAVSVILSGLALLPKISPAMPQRSRWTFLILGIDRGLTFALVLFMLVVLLMLACYPVPLSRNVKIHALLYSVFFLASSMGSLLHSVWGLKYADWVDGAFMGVASACTLMWYFLLTPAGEAVHVQLPEVSPEHESRLLHQIESLNTTLLRASRH